MFSKKLLHWHRHHNNRTMPWKGEQDPYKIWISEIVLQQTRVEQGTRYYEALLSKYPTVKHMAAADQTELYALWQGLGYYNRCKNMLYTAQEIALRYNGNFPDTYDNILKLKGIGPYTAAAISSFAFHLPYAVVDGNVVRILSRYFGIKTDFYTTIGKKEFESVAQDLLDKKNSALYNQAIMDLGATVCKPQAPLCDICPLNKKCVAFQTNTIALYPVKKTKLIIKNRYFHFMVLEDRDGVYIQIRSGQDIWQNLHTFYCIEGEDFIPEEFPFIKKNQLLHTSEQYTQKLTHQKIHGLFYKIKIKNKDTIADLNLIKVKKSALKNFAFPRMIISFFEKNNYL